MFAPKINPKLIALGAAGTIALAAGHAAAADSATTPKVDVGRDSSASIARVKHAAEHLRKATSKSATTASSAQPSGGVASPETYGVSQATLDAIASCESGGDPTAVSADGTYRGLYQFDQSTWESVGGTGDPAAASPAEQSMRAAILYSRSGSSPWPVCGQ